MVPRHILAVTRQLVLTCIKKEDEEKERTEKRKRKEKRKKKKRRRRSKWPTLFVKGWSGLPSG